MLPRARHVYGLVLASALLVTGTSALRAEDRPFRIGIVSLHSKALSVHVAGIREDLQKLGYIEGKTIEIESHFTDGDKDEARAILRSFIEKKVDVIVPWTTTTVQLAKAATQTIPMAMIASDPIEAKLVPSLSHPGGNITGVSMSGPELAGKRLELLREIKPGIRKIAFLAFAPSPGAAAFIRESKANADHVGIELIVQKVNDPHEINAALFDGLKKAGIEAVIIQPFFTGHAREIASLGMKTGLLVMSDYPSFARAGALASLGVDLGAQVRRTAYFIDRILKGAKPADLPVEQPTVFQLVINVKTAKALGLAISPQLMIRADEVIE